MGALPRRDAAQPSGETGDDFLPHGQLLLAEHDLGLGTGKRIVGVPKDRNAQSHRQGQKLHGPAEQDEDGRREALLPRAKPEEAVVEVVEVRHGRGTVA